MEAEDSEALTGKILDVMMSEQGDRIMPETTKGSHEMDAAAPEPKMVKGLRRYRTLVSTHLAQFGQDVRYGLRGLFASPGFTLVALLSLSLGICIATCAFSEMNGMALRTVPDVHHPGELVALQSPTSYPIFRRLREQNDLFSSTMAYAAPDGEPYGNRARLAAGR